MIHIYIFLINSLPNPLESVNGGVGKDYLVVIPWAACQSDVSELLWSFWLVSSSELNRWMLDRVQLKMNRGLIFSLIIFISHFMLPLLGTMSKTEFCLVRRKTKYRIMKQMPIPNVTFRYFIMFHLNASYFSDWWRMKYEIPDLNILMNSSCNYLCCSLIFSGICVPSLKQFIKIFPRINSTISTSRWKHSCFVILVS